MFLKVKCNSRTYKNGILLTFDDGPDKINTPAILNILEKNKVKALFFVAGEKAGENSLLLKDIYLKGHLIGNHSYSHSNFFPFYFQKRMVSELKKSSEMIERITEGKVFYFRPPFGVTNPGIASAVKKFGYKTVGWSVRSLDTVLKERQKILLSVTKKVKGGDIVLFHDTVKGTVEMLDEFIAYCKKEGFEFTDPEQFLSEE